MLGGGMMAYSGGLRGGREGGHRGVLGGDDGIQRWVAGGGRGATALRGRSGKGGGRGDQLQCSGGWWVARGPGAGVGAEWQGGQGMGAVASGICRWQRWAADVGGGMADG